MQNTAFFLFVSDGFERRDLDRLVRGLIAGHQSDQHREHQREDHELRLDDGCAHHAFAADERLLDKLPRDAPAAERAEREQIDDDGYDEAENKPQNAAEKADAARLHEEHRADIAHIAAERLHNADLLRALGDGHDHRVRDADGRDQKRDRTEATEHQLDLAGLLVELVAHALHRIRTVAQVLDGLLHIRHGVEALSLDVDA